MDAVMDKIHTTAVVLAAGRGTRMGSSVAKQYLEIGGKPVLVHALEVFARSNGIDQILLVTSVDQIDYCREEIVEKYQIPKVAAILAGGAERYLSVYNALTYLEMQKPTDGKCYVLIHDGARPFVTEKILERTLQTLEEVPAVCVGMPVKDTIKITDENGIIVSSPKRSLVWQAQTPQGFELNLILTAFHKLMEQPVDGITDDAMVVETMTGVKVQMVEGAYTNLKITTPEDLVLAEQLLDR